MNMFKKLWHKKGVSPLIATVLLIAFAVSLGAVVMNWGRGYVESTMEQAEVQSSEKISCSMDTSMGIVQVGDKARLCIDRDVGEGVKYTLNFTLINTGTVDLQGVQITEMWANKAPEQYPVRSSEPIAKSRMFYNGTDLSVISTSDGPEIDLEDLDMIEIAPLILVRGVETVCLEHSIKRRPSEIGDC